MNLDKPRNSKLVYLLFLIPPILAYASWQFFPTLASWLISGVFRYPMPQQPANWLWYAAIHFFYTWYTFLAIGAGGTWVIAATLARKRSVKIVQKQHPMVSFIVPAYDEEKNVTRCVKSLCACARRYAGTCEIIVVDDGSSDYTYETAWAAIQSARREQSSIRGRVIRHSANLGKIEVIRTAVDRVRSELVAVVDADSWWMPDTLTRLVDYMLSNGKKAVTGYVHPSDGDSEVNPYVVLQQLEYSQGMGITRHAQSLGNNVLVVPGAIGLYRVEVLRGILEEKNIRSVTEDLEITLQMHKENDGVGYINTAIGSSIVPRSFGALWRQRRRWFSGWLHNTLSIHGDLLTKKSWLTLLLWYSYIFEYGGVLVDLAALFAFPFLFWFSPDRVYFIASLLAFVPYSLLIGAVNQSIALKFAYDQHNYRDLVFYTPYYAILRLVNGLARLVSSIKFLLGDRGNWHQTR